MDNTPLNICFIFYIISLMKRFFVVFLIIAVVLTAAYYFFFWRESNNVLTSSLPDYFPKEIIQDPYIINLEVASDVFKLENEKHRAQITYISHKNKEENEKSFKNYFRKNEFQIQQERDIGDQRFISAVKDQAIVSVSLWKTSPVRISIIYIVLK